MMLNLSNYSTGDKFLLKYIQEQLMIKYNLSKNESLNWISQSFLPSMLDSNPLFIHHEDPDKLVTMVAENNLLKREFMTI